MRGGGGISVPFVGLSPTHIFSNATVGCDIEGIYSVLKLAKSWDPEAILLSVFSSFTPTSSRVTNLWLTGEGGKSDFWKVKMF